jgi:hypothetical protein
VELTSTGAIAVSQIIDDTWMSSTNAPGYAGRCRWMSITVYGRLLDKRWTRNLIYAVST